MNISNTNSLLIIGARGESLGDIQITDPLPDIVREALLDYSGGSLVAYFHLVESVMRSMGLEPVPMVPLIQITESSSNVSQGLF